MGAEKPLSKVRRIIRLRDMGVRRRSLSTFCGRVMMAVTISSALQCCAAPVQQPLVIGNTAPIRGSWPMYQLRPDHNAVLQRRNLSASWTYDAGARINSGLAVVNDSLFFDTFSHQVVALNLRDGTVK